MKTHANPNVLENCQRPQASSSATLLESVAVRLERRAREMEKARAFTDEERTQRRCMVVIYMEISNMLRAECETLSNDQAHRLPPSETLKAPKPNE